MNESIIVALITGSVALIGSLISNSRLKSLIMYRLEQLEKKQDKHNNLIERTYRVEESVKSAHHRIDEIR